MTAAVQSLDEFVGQEDRVRYVIGAIYVMTSVGLGATFSAMVLRH
jgi:hypothetical protein